MMTIDEVIKNIELTCEYLKITGVFDNPANEKCKPSLDIAIETMRKYQKIKTIVEAWNDDENAMILADELRKVLKDENDKV